MRSTISNKLRAAPIILGLASTALAVLACQADLGGPSPPGAPISTSGEEAHAFGEMWAGAVEAAETSDGQLRLIVGEEQLTSFFALRLQEQRDPILRDPQVFLRKGLIQVHGVAERGLVRANVLIGIEPVIQQDGSLSFRITSAEFGPLPVPDSIKEGTSTLISEAFAGPIGSLATGIRLDAIAIQNGEMAISGSLR